MQPWLRRRCGAAACDRNSGRLEVGAHQVVPLPLADLAHDGGEEAGGVVDQHVQAPEPLQRLVHHRGQRGRVQQVGLHQRHGIGAHRVELRLQGPRLLRGRAVVDHQVHAALVQQPADRRSHSARTTGDQRDLLRHPSLLARGVKFYRISPSPPPLSHRRSSACRSPAARGASTQRSAASAHRRGDRRERRLDRLRSLHGAGPVRSRVSATMPAAPASSARPATS